MAVAARSRGPVEAAGERPRRRSPLAALSVGHLVMIVAGLTGMLLTLALLRGADERVRVAVAARDLPAGAVVDGSVFRYERVKMDDGLLATVLRPDDVAGIEGSVVSARIEEGELVVRSDLRPVAAGNGLRAVSIPIDPARAVNGDLAAGDRVDIMLAAEREVAVIVASAEVLHAGAAPGRGGFAAVDEQFTVTLAVDGREAQLLTAAITDGDILLARSTGARPADDLPPLPVDFSAVTPSGS